jgi:hypothetical protein
MWLPRQRHVFKTPLPRHLPSPQHLPHNRHFIFHIISTSDVASQSMTITFVTDFGLRAGFNGLYTNL